MRIWSKRQIARLLACTILLFKQQCNPYEFVSTRYQLCLQFRFVFDNTTRHDSKFITCLLQAKHVPKITVRRAHELDFGRSGLGFRPLGPSPRRPNVGWFLFLPEMTECFLPACPGIFETYLASGTLRSCLAFHLRGACGLCRSGDLLCRRGESFRG